MLILKSQCWSYQFPPYSQIDLDCVVDNGIDCSNVDIQVPDFECTNNTELRFSYENGTCPESDNEQDDFQCEDFECTIDGNVRVFCESEGDVFCNCTVAEGGLIVITSQLVLPDRLVCTVFPENSNEKCQEFVLNPSGTTDNSTLNLKDKYGSLTVETCTDTEENSNNCLVDATFTYNFRNAGSSDLLLEAVTTTCNGKETDLLATAVPPIEPGTVTLPAGQAAAITKNSYLDACAGYLEKKAYIAGVGEDGEICFDEDNLNIDFVSQSPSMTPTDTRLPCNLTLDSVCAPPQESWLPDNQTDCALPPLQDLCSERPSKMVMRYNGGGCDQSDNVQPEKSGCVDFDEGPPTDQGTESYITVVATKNPETVYFQGIVPVGEQFELDDSSGRVEADMTIKIYEPDATGVGPGRILQDQFFHSSCSQNLFLKDRFGSVQLVAWLNGIQGFVTCFVDVIFSFDIVNGVLGNPSEETSSATLLSFFTLTNLVGDGDRPIFVNLTDSVYGKTINPGDSFKFEAVFTIDATVRRFYTAISNLVGRNDDSNGICQASSSLSFTAGADLTPIFPTKAPTVSPTSTAFPTVDPQTVDCDITAGITCESDGRPCETSLKFPTVTCSGDRPNTMEFMFTGAECLEDSSPALKNCENDNGIPADIEGARIVVTDDKEKDLYFDQVVDKYEIFNVVVNGDGKLAIKIYGVGDGSYNVLLQELETDTKCETDKKQLVTADMFGALQLTGFDNGVQSVSGETSITLSYFVANNERYKTTIDSAEATMSYVTSFIPPTVELAKKGDVYELGTFTKTINLFQLVNTKERYSLSVTGYNSNNIERKCDDATAYSVEIQGDTLV